MHPYRRRRKERTETASDGLPAQRGFNPRVLWQIGLAAVTLCVMIVMFKALSAWGRGGADILPPALVDAGQTVADRVAKDAAAEEGRRVEAEFRRQALRQQVDELLALVETLDHEIKFFTAQADSLPTSDDGRFLAASETHAKAFDALINEHRPATTIAASIRTRARRTASSLDGALTDPRAFKTAARTLRNRLEADTTAASSALETYRHARRRLRDLVLNARATQAKAAETLQAALDQIRATDAGTLAAELAAARDRHQAETRQKVAEVEYRKGSQIGDATKAKREAEMEAERMRIQTEAEITKTKAEQERLQRLAEDPSIQKKYPFFLERGMQFTGNRKPGPASYSFLSKKILHNFEDYRMYATGHYPNDRPLLTPLGGPDDPRWEQYQKDWELFRDLAPLWLKAGKLNP